MNPRLFARTAVEIVAITLSIWVYYLATTQYRPTPVQIGAYVVFLAVALGAIYHKWDSLYIPARDA